MDVSSPPTSGNNPIDHNTNTNTNQTASFQTTSTSPITQPVASPENQTITSSTGTKKVTITSPALTTTKQSQQHGFAPSESGKSGSSFSHSKLMLRTCCGVVELTSMKLACLAGMVVTVFGLLVLAAISIASFVMATNKSTDILINIGRASYLFESSNAFVVKYVFTSTPNNGAKFVEAQLLYYNFTNEMGDIVADIVGQLNEPSLKSLINATSVEAIKLLQKENSQILVQFNLGQAQDVYARLNSDTYNDILSKFKSGLDGLVSFIQDKEKEKDTQVLAITSVQLIVIVISLFVVLPIIVFVFTFAINRDSLYLEKIRRANAIMLIDTMEDDGLRAVFKIHCEKEKSSENYLLLEKIQYYRSLCERSLELQAKLFRDDPNSDSSSDISESAHPAKKKKESSLEREYNELEVKKYEVAFEIFTEFLEVTGVMSVNISHLLVNAVKDKLDKYNDKQIDSLPEDMFNVLEKETCLVMMDTHHRFKQSLAFQREMKIDKIKIDQLKKKKETDDF